MALTRDENGETVLTTKDTQRGQEPGKGEAMFAIDAKVERVDGKEIVLKDESFRIMGACFEVCKLQGSGFLGAVYQECLAIEFDLRGIPFVEKEKLNLHYKGRELRQHYEPDFLCFGKIVVELKAVSNLSDDHRAQIINYLHATGMQVGLLVNVGHFPKVEYERFINLPNRKP